MRFAYVPVGMIAFGFAAIFGILARSLFDYGYFDWLGFCLYGGIAVVLAALSWLYFAKAFVRQQSK